MPKTKKAVTSAETKNHAIECMNLVLRPTELYLGQLNARRAILAKMITDAGEQGRCDLQIERIMMSLDLEIIEVSKAVDGYRDRIDEILS